MSVASRVDCSLCVQVCPTGIDIRDGLQYMCIGCGACVDVCDQVMDKMGYEPGLIRYTSGNAITDGLTQSQVRRRLLRPRTIAYSVLLGVIAIGFVVSLATRTTLRMDVIRDRGALGREVAGGMIENVYRLQVINTAEAPLVLDLSVSGVPGLTIQTADDGQASVRLDGSTNRLVPVVLRAPAESLTPGVHEIQFKGVGTRAPDDVTTVVEQSSFYVPR